MAVDWARLDVNLLENIAKKAWKNGVCDLVSMAGVCRWWRDYLRGQNEWSRRTLIGVSSFDNSPWLMLPEHAGENLNDLRDYFHRPEDIYFQLHLPELLGSRCCGSGYGWLVMAQNDNFMIRLVNPFTRQQIRLPGVPFFWYDGEDIYELEMADPMEQFMTNAIVMNDPSESWLGCAVAVVILGRLFCLVNRRNAKMWVRVPTNGSITRIAHYRDKIETKCIAMTMIRRV